MCTIAAFNSIEALSTEHYFVPATPYSCALVISAALPLLRPIVIRIRLLRHENRTGLGALRSALEIGTLLPSAPRVLSS